MTDLLFKSNLILLVIALVSCSENTKYADIDFEREVFYEIFPEISDTIYHDLRLNPLLPKPSATYLLERGFDANKDYDDAYAEWIMTDEYAALSKRWKESRDSVLRDTNSIIIAFPDSVDQFEIESVGVFKNHFADEEIQVDSIDLQLDPGFDVDFARLKSDNRRLIFKPLSGYPRGSKLWTTRSTYKLRAVMSCTRILFDSSRSFGILDAAYVRSAMVGNGYRIFIRKNSEGEWEIDKIEETWIT